MKAIGAIVIILALIDVLATTTGKILVAGSGGRQSVNLLRSFNHRIDGAAAQDGTQLCQPNTNTS